MDENKKAHPVTAKIPSCIEASVPQFLYDRTSMGRETLPDGRNEQLFLKELWSSKESFSQSRNGSLQSLDAAYFYLKFTN